MADHARPIQPRRTSWRAYTGPAVTRRLAAAAVLAPALALLILAAGLTPDPAGKGTHTALSLPPCGFKAATHLPCLSCGMTTSFAHAANGRLLTAFATQPMGTLLALLDAALVWIAAYAMITGLSLAPLGRAMTHPKIVTALISVAALAWAWTLLRHVMGW